MKPAIMPFVFLLNPAISFTFRATPLVQNSMVVSSSFAQLQRSTAGFGAILLVLLLTGITGSASARQHPGRPEIKVGTEAEQIAIENLLLRGMTRMYIEDYDGALDFIQRALAIRPSDPVLLFSVSQIRNRRGETEAAMFYLEQALDSDSLDADLWMYMANLAGEAGDASRTIHAFRSILGIKPDHTIARQQLIELYRRLSRLQEALTVLEDAPDADRNPLWLRVKADLYDLQGSTEQLISTLLNLRQVEPEEADIAYRLGTALVRAGKSSQAINAFRTTLELDPGYTDAALALSELQPGEFAETGVISDSIGRSSPGATPRDSDGRLQRADRLLDMGRFLEAAELYRKMTMDQPRLLQAWVSGIRAYTAAGRNSDALALANEALSLFPGYVPVLIEKAWVLAESGQTEEAAQLLKTVESRIVRPTDRKRALDLRRRIANS